jgi:hypothetical protein
MQCDNCCRGLGILKGQRKKNSVKLYLAKIAGSEDGAKSKVSCT